MRLDRFDLNLLVTLDALLQERSVTRAAERLHLGQSAASAALGRLREHFEDELLVLVAREMVLTPLARSLVRPVRQAILQVKAAVSSRPAFQAATSTLAFTLRASEYASQVLLPAVMQTLAQQAPGFNLQLQGMTPAMFDLMERGQTDLLILPERYASRVDSPRQVLFSDDYVCMAWAANPLIGDALSAEQYFQLGHVAVSRYLPGGQAFEAWLLGSLPQRPKVEVSVENASLIPLLLVGTHRIAHMQRLLARDLAGRFPLRILELPVPLPALVELLCWPQYLQDDPAHRWLRGLVFDAAKAL